MKTWTWNEMGGEWQRIPRRGISTSRCDGAWSLKRSVKGYKLDPWKPKIDSMNQRSLIVVLLERLREKKGYDGGIKSSRNTLLVPSGKKRPGSQAFLIRGLIQIQVVDIMVTECYY